MKEHCKHWYVKKPISVLFSEQICYEITNHCHNSNAQLHKLKTMLKEQITRTQNT